MIVACKPARNQEAAAPLRTAAHAPAEVIASPAGAARKPTMIRFDAAKRRGTSRSGWIAYTISKALDDEGAA